MHIVNILARKESTEQILVPAQRLGQLVDEFPGWYDPLRELGVVTDRILIPDTLTARLSTVASDLASSAFDASIRGRGPP